MRRTKVAYPRADQENTRTSSGVSIPPIGLAGILQTPKNAHALVAFAHSGGSSRVSSRNTSVARGLNDWGMATLFLDLLTPAEEAVRANVFDVRLLADRLVEAIRWIDGQVSLAKLPLGLFGVSTGAAGGARCCRSAS